MSPRSSPSLTTSADTHLTNGRPLMSRGSVLSASACGRASRAARWCAASTTGLESLLDAADLLRRVRPPRGPPCGAPTSVAALTQRKEAEGGKLTEAML